MMCPIGNAVERIVARHEDVHRLAEQMFEQEQSGRRWADLSAEDHAHYIDGALDVLGHAWVSRTEGRLC